MKIAVVALGKIGLPLAVQFASKGHEVVGVDVNATVVDLVNAGTEPFPGEAHLQEKLSSTVADGRLRAGLGVGAELGSYAALAGTAAIAALHAAGVPEHLVQLVNADEGEPGTFKDQLYLNADPHRFLIGDDEPERVDVEFTGCFQIRNHDFHVGAAQDIWCLNFWGLSVSHDDSLIQTASTRSVVDLAPGRHGIETGKGFSLAFRKQGCELCPG